MTQQTLFYRKIAYIVLIAILLFPLYRLGSPSQRQQDGSMSSGGVLAEKRSEGDLSEANIGKIDPTGSAVKLATFGMRGVAISLLWHRSREYEKRADWDNVIATANQIITLEPHFTTIWDFVGWQLSYNASAMFDDYRERYRWVIRGFEFVQKGTTYNRTAPKLYVRTGWIISQKVGIADEKKQYRRLLREDDEFAARQAEQEIFVTNRDNWLLGHAFYKRAEDLYENHNGDIGKETRLLFFGRAPMNRIRFAEWMSIDGCGVNKTNTPLFDEENCAKAWRLAQEDWESYSNKKVETTIPDKVDPNKFRVTSLNVQREAAEKILAPGVNLRNAHENEDHGDRREGNQEAKELMPELHDLHGQEHVDERGENGHVEHIPEEHGDPRKAAPPPGGQDDLALPRGEPRAGQQRDHLEPRLLRRQPRDAEEEGEKFRNDPVQEDNEGKEQQGEGDIHFSVLLRLL